MKKIKFDLPINGNKVRKLEELRDNLTDEILALARSSQLERWLRTRQLLAQADAVVKAVQDERTDKSLFLALCKVLEVEAHPDDVKAIFDAPPAPGRFIPGARYAELYEQMRLRLEKMNKEVNGFNVEKTNSPASNSKNESGRDNGLSSNVGGVFGLADLLKERALEYNLVNNSSDAKGFIRKKNASDGGGSSIKKTLDVKFIQKYFGELSAFQNFDFSKGCKVVNVFVKEGSRVVKGSLVAEVINRSSLERMYSPVVGYVEKVFLEVGGYIKIGGDLISVVESDA